jgi:hypothetical protein
MSATPTNSGIDYSSRDDGIHIAGLAPTRSRRGVDEDIRLGYWRDCHATQTARLPGLYKYTAFALEHDDGGNWPVLPGITNDLPAEDQLDGMAELDWASEDDLAAFNAAVAETGIGEDEQNLFDMVIFQVALPGNHRTLFDGIQEAAPNGNDPNLRLFVGLRRADAVTIEEFREHVIGKIAPALAEHELVLKVRVVGVEDFLPEHWDSPNVRHDVAIDDQYQAFIELAFKHRLDMRRCYASPAFRKAVNGLNAYVRHVNAFPVKDVYAFVVDGKRTLAGEMGATRAMQITHLGAINACPADLLT